MHLKRCLDMPILLLTFSGGLPDEIAVLVDTCASWNWKFANGCNLFVTVSGLVTRTWFTFACMHCWSGLLIVLWGTSLCLSWWWGFFSCWEERMRSLVYPRLYTLNLVFAETACFCAEGTQMEGGAGTGWCWSSWESWQSNSSLGVCSVLELPNPHITNVRFIIRCDLTTVHTGFTRFYRWHLNQVCLHLTI